MVCHRSLVTGPPHRLLGGVAWAATRHSELCQGDTHDAASLAMQTDSEQLLLAGVELAGETWREFKAATGWDETKVDRMIGHQVGSVHRRKKIYEALGLDLLFQGDFSTFETLGNMGSVSLPATLAKAVGGGRQCATATARSRLFGIGSGLNCLMLSALEW